MPLVLQKTGEKEDPLNPFPPRDYQYIFPNDGSTEQYPWLRSSSDSSAATLCRFCSQIDFCYLFNHQTLYRIRLGTHGEVKARKCLFCDFILKKSIRVPALRHKDFEDSDIVYLHSERSSHQKNSSSDDNKEDISNTLMVWINRDGVQGRSIKISVAFLNIHAYPVMGSPSFQLSHGIHTASNNWLGNSRVVRPQYDVEVVKNWLNVCQTLRPNSQQRLQAGYVQRVIDIYMRCLAETSDIMARPIHDTRYVALSYVWGKIPQKITLTETSYKSLHSPGSLSATNLDLPRTIRHAMVVCRDIGIRYLWIDALCIIQDSLTKMKQISCMNRVYEDAFVTIIAAHGEDADAGLCGVHEKGQDERQTTVQIQGMAMICEEPPLDTILSSAYWNKRAWTYQEFLLSPVRLVFTERMIYFSCPHGTNCEDVTLADHSINTRSARLNLSGYEINLRQGRNWKTYTELVSHYSTKKLTHDTDMVNAFSGISEALKASMFPGTEFICGIPITSLTAALLWRRCWGCELCNNTTLGLTKRGGFSNETGPNGISPSWSWAGWEGHVKYSTWLLGHDDPSLSLIPRINWFHGPYLDCETMLIMRNQSIGKWHRPKTIDPYLQRTANSSDQPHIDDFSLERAPISQNQFLCLEADVVSFPVVGRRFPVKKPRDVDDVAFEDGSWYVAAELGHPLVIYDPVTKTQCGVVYDDVNMCEAKNWPSSPGWFSFIKLSQTILGKYDSIELSLGINQEKWDDILPGPGKDRLKHITRSTARDFRGYFDYDSWDYSKKWCVYNVLMVIWAKHAAFRIGVGKIHVDAFDNAESFERKVFYLG